MKKLNRTKQLNTHLHVKIRHNIHSTCKRQTEIYNLGTGYNVLYPVLQVEEEAININHHLQNKNNVQNIFLRNLFLSFKTGIINNVFLMLRIKKT